MSGASATVSAAPPVSSPAPSTATAPPPEAAGQPGPAPSFTDVLSAQRAASRHDEGDGHDTDGKRGPAHGAKEAQDHGTHGSTSSSSSSSSSSSTPVPSSESPSDVAVPGLADAVAVTAVPVAGATVADESTTAPEGHPSDGTPLEPVGALVTVGGTSSQAAVSPDATGGTSTGASSPDAVVVPSAAVVSAAVSQDVPDATSNDDADEASGHHGRVDDLPAGSAATAPAASPLPSDTVHGAVPTHSGPAAPPAAAHATPSPAEAASVAGATPAAAPLAHPAEQSAPTPSDAVRVAPSGPRLGEPTAPSASSVAQQAATALDVDGLSGSISRPLSDGNGTYTVTVALHPAELGHVQAVMSLDGNSLQVSLTAQTQTGHDALANATEALKNQLGRGGVSVNVTLRDPGSRSGGEERHRPPTTTSPGSFITEGSATETPLLSGLAASQIHLVL